MNWSNWIDTTAKRRVWKNFFSLSALQALSYLLPLLTIPYLFRVLGAELFGILALATATVGYLGLLIDYGFNLSATRLIAISKDDHSTLSSHVCGVFETKLILIGIAFIFFSVIFWIDSIHDYLNIYWLTFLGVIISSMNPTWFFQGIEEMRHILLSNILSRILFTGLIFIFVKTEQDAWLVPLLTALGAFLALSYAVLILYIRYNISFSFQPIKRVQFYLDDGWDYFTANLAISLYTISNVFILGLFATAAVVGYYSAAERLIRAIQNLFIPVSQAIFPYVVKKTQISTDSGINFLRKMLRVSSWIMFVMGLLILFAAESIAEFIYGRDSHLQITLILSIFAFIPLLVTMSNIYGIQMMLNLGYKKAFNTILWGSGALGIVLSFYFVPIFHELATAWIMLLVEGIITLSMFSYLRFKKIL